LVIDAMGLLHSGRFDEFCLVSSDKASSASSAATPIIEKIITQMESEDGWVPLGEVGKQLANLASDFDPRSLGFRKLSDLVRRTNSFGIDHPKGGSIAFAQSPLPDQLRNRRPPPKLRHEKNSL
jgi:hypothetical protein